VKTKIGLTEAKAKFPELLRQVKAGKSFTITYHGAEVADLVPSEAKRVDIKKSIEEGRD